MNELQKRLARMDKKVKRVEPTESEFIEWTGNPWTEEQMAEAKMRQPDVELIWRPLLETPEDTARKMAYPTPDLNAEPEHAEPELG